jgi:hypothetical protein
VEALCRQASGSGWLGSGPSCGLCPGLQPDPSLLIDKSRRGSSRRLKPGEDAASNSLNLELGFFDPLFSHPLRVCERIGANIQDSKFNERKTLLV